MRSRDCFVKKRNFHCMLAMVLIIMAVSLCAGGCAERNRKNEEITVVTSTDPGAAAELFPALEGIEEIEMEQVRYGGSTPLGPADYQYSGYITLSEKMAGRYAEAYEFEDIVPPDVTFYEVPERSGDWKYSRDFRKDIVRKSLVGDVWMDGTTLLFSVGTT